MPIVTVNMIEGRTLDQKRELAKQITDVVVKTLNSKPEKVRVMINEMKKEHYAIAGTLAIDE